MCLPRKQGPRRCMSLVEISYSAANPLRSKRGIAGQRSLFIDSPEAGLGLVRQQSGYISPTPGSLRDHGIRARTSRTDAEERGPTHNVVAPQCTAWAGERARGWTDAGH